MSQIGYTPILIYSSSTTTNAPAVGNLTNSTLGSELAINITDGKLFYKDNANVIQVIGWKTTPTTAGGTGLTSYTAGDLLYYATGTTLSKLAIGASGRWLGSSGTAPQWNAPAALTKTDDTNVTLTLGGSASTALLNAASLTLGWTGTLATSRGGTGLSSFTANGIAYASSTSALATGSALTFDGTNFATTGTGSFAGSVTVSNASGNNSFFANSTNNGSSAYFRSTAKTAGGVANTWYVGQNLSTSAGTFEIYDGTLAGRVLSSVPGSGNINVEAGNLIIGTSGKGITSGNFSLGLGANGNTSAILIDTTNRALINTTTVGGGAGGSTILTAVSLSGQDAVFIKGQGSSAGNLPLGLWNDAGTGDNALLYFYTNNTISYKGGIDFNRALGLVRYNTSSDGTLKNIIGDSDGKRSIEILKTTRLRDYTWKDDPEQNVVMGPIAQELYETYKGAVSVGGNVERVDDEGNVTVQYRPWAVDKTAYSFHLVAGWQAHEKTIQDQQALIEKLIARVDALEAK